jgi:hypothetical protein
MFNSFYGSQYPQRAYIYLHMANAYNKIGL